ncbi:MAG: STAS domain-containing protein [Pseudomonadota bacterium]
MNLMAKLLPHALVIHVLEDRIDAAGAIQFKEKMRGLVNGPSPIVILDLSQVAFLDSSGLGAVVSVLKMMGPDRKLQLSGLTPTVEKVFRLTRMDTIFTIHRTLPEEVRHVG